MLQGELTMDDIKVIYLDMPTTIRSYVISRNDFFTIVLNSKLSCEQNAVSYEHELNHIKNGDYEKKCSVNMIEFMAHKQKSPPAGTGSDSMQ